MTSGLLVDGVDEIECVAGEVALICFRLAPDGEKFRAQVSGLRFVEADVAVVAGIGRTDVVVFVEEALGRVGVRVDDDGGILNLAGLGADRLCWRGQAERENEGESQGRESINHSRIGILYDPSRSIGSPISKG